MSVRECIKTTRGKLATFEYGRSLRDYANHNGEIPVLAPMGKSDLQTKCYAPFHLLSWGEKAPIVEFITLLNHFS